MLDGFLHPTLSFHACVKPCVQFMYMFVFLWLPEVDLNNSLPYFLRQGLSLNLELNHLVRLAGQ